MTRDEELLAKRLLELSRQAFHRGILTYTDFLNLNEQSILHALPKNSLYTGYVLFGGYDFAERQMAAFLPEDALSLCGRYHGGSADFSGIHENAGFFSGRLAVLRISPLHEKYADALTHRDYLGAVMNLGLERGKTGDILVDGTEALIFVDARLKDFIKEGMEKGDLRGDLEMMPAIFHFWGMLSGIIRLAANKEAYIAKAMDLSKEQFLEYGFSMLYRSIAAKSDVDNRLGL